MSYTYIIFNLFTELNAMSYRYTLEEILQFSIDKLTNFSVSSFVWNTINEVSIQFMIHGYKYVITYNNYDNLIMNCIFG